MHGPCEGARPNINRIDFGPASSCMPCIVDSVHCFFFFITRHMHIQDLHLCMCDFLFQFTRGQYTPYRHTVFIFLLFCMCMHAGHDWVMGVVFSSFFFSYSFIPFFHSFPFLFLFLLYACIYKIISFLLLCLLVFLYYLYHDFFLSF